MSLTSFVNTPDVRRKFRTEFSKEPVRWQTKPLAPPQTSNYALVGTAFDYLLRFYLKRLNPQANTTPWIAEVVPPLLSNTPKIRSKAENIVTLARKAYSRYLQDGKITRHLLKAVVLLAGLDPIYRSGRGREYIGKWEPHDLLDLKALISIVNPSYFKARKVLCLNPTFGRASKLVGGGDADILIDHTLIEVKTTKHLKVRRDTYNQLIGYYTLSAIGGIDGIPSNHKISTLAIYFSRFGVLQTFDVSTIINLKEFPAFIRWFQKRAKHPVIDLTGVPSYMTIG